ncbi:hypothetical protein ACSS6W_006447 [Trichoderma asperelloides]|uniref:Uncharacterized protein n=1 Tax=Trichoderma asperellum TaxID=101201 RepID=A0A6V8QVB8_TRIAP|nr:hypothetical protein TASIC1_0006038500 [Trichoderma asperellum]
MKYHAATMLAAAAAALLSTVSASSTVVCTENELGSSGQSDVCRVDNLSPEPEKDYALPCIEVIFRDNTCHFEASEPDYTKAHDECQCSGTTFSAWVECQKCLVDHGFHNEDSVYWSKILDAASKALCTGTPIVATASSLSTPVQAGTVIPTPTTPISDDGSNQLPIETFKGLNQTAVATQGPGVLNQTATPTAGAVGPQKTCIEDFKRQNVTTVASDSSTPTVPIIPNFPTSTFTSADSIEPLATTSDWLLPGMFPSSETSDAASSSSFGKSGLAVAIAGAIIMGVL